MEEEIKEGRQLTHQPLESVNVNAWHNTHIIYNLSSITWETLSDGFITFR